jgi:hypothetical protein
MASVYIQLPLVTSTVSGTIATVQGALTPQYDQATNINDLVVTTFTKPVGAKVVKIMTPLGNATDLKITLDGSTAPSATVGMEIQPGRSEDFTAVGDVKAIAKTAATNQELFLHWGY